MSYIVIFFILTFPFSFIHFIKRIFEHTYLWQIKEYRWDRMRSYMRSGKLPTLLNPPTLIAFMLSAGSILVLRRMTSTVSYIVYLVGFGYFVYSSLVSLPKFLSKEIIRPKKSKRNMLIVGTALLLSLLPLILSFWFYYSLDAELAPISSEGTVSLSELIPEKRADGLVLIPLETATIILYFMFLFVFDLMLPAFLSVLVGFTSIFSRVVRKKKSSKRNKK